MNGVTKEYHRPTTALRDIIVSVNPGESVYTAGPSGTDKSGFIGLLYREERTSAEALKVEEFNLTKLKKRDAPILCHSIGVVLQDYKLLPKKTVFKNVAYVTQVISEKPREIKKCVPEVPDLVEFKHEMRPFPDQLFSGEQQCVATVHAIAGNPKVLITDEPTGNLGPEASWEIMQLLECINFQGATVLMATHNKQIVGDPRHCVIAIEDGRIVHNKEGRKYGYNDQKFLSPFIGIY